MTFHNSCLFVVAFACIIASAVAMKWECKSDAYDMKGTEPKDGNIENLHPAHVTMAMAFGDSITAGFAIKAGFYEYRNLSWSIGTGSKSHLTFPFMASKYSGEVKGASEGQRLPVVPPQNLPHGDYHRYFDKLNFAEPMAAVHLNSIEEQWGHFQKGIKDFPDYNDHWKVITIWMTANDVCGYCKKAHTEETLKKWTEPVNQLIHKISKKMDKVYVNLISTMDLSHINRLQKSDLFCRFLHGVVMEECGCIDRGSKKELKQLDENIHLMNKALHNLSQEWYDRLQKEGRKDMAVVTQSFMEGVGAELDRSFLSRLDCFHPSEKAHTALAVGLWNSMLCKNDRENHCGTPFALDMKPTCPGPDDTFYVGPDVIPN